MGGLAHYLEEEGLATTQISLIRKHTEIIKPPRALWVSFELGRPFGKPNDSDFQSRVLSAALDLLRDKQTENPNPDYPPADTLNLATDDLKAFYTEAVTAQPGPTGTSDQLADWFYGQTAAGRLLYAIRDKGIQSNDEYFQIVAGHLIIPATKPNPAKPELNSHKGTKTQKITV